MARNFFGFLAKNKPVQRFRKTNNIPGKRISILLIVLILANSFEVIASGRLIE